jgi:protein ImuB
VLFPALGSAAESAAALERLARHALRFTSLVSLEPPAALLLEVRGSLRLFGSATRLHDEIDACWRALGLQALSAVAPSTLAALWCARAGSRVCVLEPALLTGSLARLPLTATGWDPAVLQTLRSMGVLRVGEMLRLPRAGLARRFGPAALRELDVALARQEAPRRSFVPRERFRARCDLETEIEYAAILEQLIAPLLDECAAFLRLRQAGVQGVELRLRHRSLPATRLRLGLAGVTSEARRLRDVLAQRLQGLVLAAPVRAIELVSGRLQPLSAASLEVFAGRGGVQGRDTALQLVERLRARLGGRAVYGVSPLPEHRPEAAWRRVHALQLAATVSAAAGGAADAVQSLPRPVWILEAPLPVAPAEVAAQDDPERIESGWWDGRGIARDYYVVRGARGVRLWVFQERHSRQWYLHGVFG